jgi:maleamate amidohydrolase
MTERWEEFLTERDKQHMVVSGWARKEPFGLGSRPAVLIVDDYYAALGTEREPLFESVKKWPMSCGLEGWAAIDRTVELLTVARQVGVPLVYLRSWEEFPSNWVPREPSGGRAAITDKQHLLGNEIVAEIAPRAGELVIDKTAPSAFHHTPLVSYLNRLRVDTVVVCGETTSGCVRATVVDAMSYRYKVAVAEECCFDRTEAAHWMSMFDMHHKYADVMQLADVIDYLGKCDPGL